MALTINKLREDIPAFGAVKFVPVTITFDSSYPTGGEAIAASDFGLDKIHFVAVNAFTNVATKGVTWLSSTSKLKVWVEDSISGISAEAAGSSDQSAVSVEALVVGTDTP
jgi:hypothetical protein